MMKWAAGCSALVTTTVAIGACYGGVEAGKESEVTVTDHAALVSQKRKWLQGFDRHCDACIAAFDLCERGAEDDERDACQVAMDACMRGDLLGGDAGLGDAGEPDESDAGDIPPDEQDGGLESDAGGDFEDAGSEDAGIEDPDFDAGIGEDDAGDDAGLEGDADVVDDDDRAKEVLLDDIGTCLDLARGCLEPDDADFAQCVTGLQVCVDQAVEAAFEVICSEQVRACRTEGGSRDEVESVERACRERLLI